ncbi:hypothetical protein NP493_678g00021 [Ridgeia piscesae]|uniref:Uncharacterized protein n=1 Tax=Ridgeia piscesae TaxID=27915 RepID=A0AAD9NPS1_RIDPI|nr:hypothetical protein NP493_678g00021 [Ridgeia piscesae]
MDVESGAQGERSREWRCHLRYRHRKSRMPPVVTITDEPDISVATSHIHTSAAAAMIAVQLASKRGIAKTRFWSPLSLPLPQIQNTACRHDHRRANSFAHSYIRRRRHDRRSTLIEIRHRQSSTMATSRIRRHDSFFRVPEHPMLPQQQPVSSNSASYVLSVSCLFLCGPLRRISVNARFYVQCCLVL